MFLGNLLGIAQRLPPATGERLVKRSTPPPPHSPGGIPKRTATSVARARQDLREQLAQGDREVSKAFSAAIDAWGKAEAFAATLGIAPSQLSEMRGGHRPIRLRDVLPLLESTPASLVLLAWLCDRAGLAAPRRRRRTTRRAVLETTTALVRQLDLWPRFLRRDVAAVLQTDEEDVEAVYRQAAGALREEDE